MKIIIYLLIIMISVVFVTSCKKETQSDKSLTHDSDLIQYFENEWTTIEKQIAKTADNEIYLTNDEKNIYYLINLARINPKLFADTYVESYVPRKETDYAKRKNTFISYLYNMPVSIPIKPNKN